MPVINPASSNAYRNFSLEHGNVGALHQLLNGAENVNFKPGEQILITIGDGGNNHLIANNLTGQGGEDKKNNFDQFTDLSATAKKMLNGALDTLAVKDANLGFNINSISCQSFEEFLVKGGMTKMYVDSVPENVKNAVRILNAHLDSKSDNTLNKNEVMKCVTDDIIKNGGKYLRFNNLGAMERLEKILKNKGVDFNAKLGTEIAHRIASFDFGQTLLQKGFVKINDGGQVILTKSKIDEIFTASGLAISHIFERAEKGDLHTDIDALNTLKLFLTSHDDKKPDTTPDKSNKGGETSPSKNESPPTDTDKILKGLVEAINKTKAPNIKIENSPVFNNNNDHQFRKKSSGEGNITNEPNEPNEPNDDNQILNYFLKRPVINLNSDSLKKRSKTPPENEALFINNDPKVRSSNSAIQSDYYNPTIIMKGDANIPKVKNIVVDENKINNINVDKESDENNRVEEKINVNQWPFVAINGANTVTAQIEYIKKNRNDIQPKTDGGGVSNIETMTNNQRGHSSKDNDAENGKEQPSDPKVDMTKVRPKIDPADNSNDATQPQGNKVDELTNNGWKRINAQWSKIKEKEEKGDEVIVTTNGVFTTQTKIDLKKERITNEILKDTKKFEKKYNPYIK